MNREVHVRFWESAGVRFPCATHLPLNRQSDMLGLSPTGSMEPAMIAVMEPLAGPSKRVSNGVGFQCFFTLLATVGLGVSSEGLGLR